MIDKSLEFYIDRYKKFRKFEYIRDEKLKKILYQYAWYTYFLFYLFDKIQDEELKNFMAHTTIIYIGSIIEAVVFYYASTKLVDSKSKRRYLELEEFKKVQDLKKCENLFVCELVKKEVSLNDSINFHSLINWLKDKKIISQEIIDKIDFIRKKRNLIHINVLKTESELDLILELEQIFIYMKDILDFVEIKICWLDEE